LKALQVMGIYYDACVEHQFDRAVKNATGEAGKDGGDNPDCHALITANRKMLSKILTSTQLQEGSSQAPTSGWPSQERVPGGDQVRRDKMGEWAPANQSELQPLSCAQPPGARGLVS
jgi:hypothetical protein